MGIRQWMRLLIHERCSMTMRQLQVFGKLFQGFCTVQSRLFSIASLSMLNNPVLQVLGGTLLCRVSWQSLRWVDRSRSDCESRP